VESVEASSDEREDDEYEEPAVIDPKPKTDAAKARFFYYETEEAQIPIESRDFDQMYGFGTKMGELAKVNASQSIVDCDKFNQLKGEQEDEMTFGSRPPTAPVSKNKPDPLSPSEYGGSTVNIGQITVDRRNNLIGNEF